LQTKTVFEASNNKKEELVMKNKREADGRRIKAKPAKAKGILAALGSVYSFLCSQPSFFKPQSLPPRQL